MNGVLDGCRGGLVGLAPDETSFDSRSCHQAGVAIWPVITSVIGVAVTRGTDSSFGAAAEFPDGEYQGILEHSPVVEIGNQGGKPGVEHRSGLVFHSRGKAGVNVERMVVRVGHLGPVDLDHSCSGFNQAASQQAALTEGVVPVFFTQFPRFRRQVERLPCLS